MRKTLIALVLVIPMVFLLVIFSSANLVSLNVSISVNGIRIFSEDSLDEDNTLLIDMAEEKQHKVEVELSPANATDKGYTLVSGDTSVAEVTRDGGIIPKGEGTVEITATSNDKSFTDSLTAVIVSSKPYDFDFSLFGEDGKNVLNSTADGYTGDIPTGTHTFDMSIKPLGFTDYTVTAATGVTFEADKGAKTLFLPFSGKSEITVSVPGGVGGDIKKKLELNVTKPAGAMLINGETDFSGLKLAYGTTRAKLYVECTGTPTFDSDHARIMGEPTRLGDNRYVMDIRIDKGLEEGFPATISAGGQSVQFLFNFGEFDFSVFSDMPMQTEEDGTQSVTVFTGNTASFYAVSALGADEIEYDWNFSGPPGIFSSDGSAATLSATSEGDYTLVVSASFGGKEISKHINISVVKRITAIQISNNVNVDLAECYTVAGLKYTDELTLEDNIYKLKVLTYGSGATGQSAAGEETEFSVSDESVAGVETRGGDICVVPKGEGKVIVTAEWKGNKAFGVSVKATLTLNIIKSAVAVKNAPELVKAVNEEKQVVLTDNIKLGTDKNGDVLSIEERTSMLGRTKSTYNTEWYKNTKDNLPDGADNISYVMEFKNDVYGNGFEIDADNFTHALDGSGVPLISLYKGPLYFVKFKDMASVAGQDNCAFLIRTKGVKLYGVNLLGCSDESLLDKDSGDYNLTKLNLTGTTLEINSDADIINCRVRNGRNVIRVYGGNSDGSNYFIDYLSQNKGCDGERIKVNIEGCIITYGREFILKVGANRALRASKLNGADPALTDAGGKPYPETGTTNNYGDLYTDSYFYKNYVMTDVTLKNSVLETSGLFTVGIESNFSGEFLYEGASDHQWRAFTKEWERCGGTSFASVLRLEGDVRLYDWKDVALVDSSTLIESPVGALSEWLKLDIQQMLEFVAGTYPQQYGDVIEVSDGNQFVHGGIALYGGGRNYSGVDMTNLNQSLKDFLNININIDVLSDGQGTMQKQGEILPRAAGKHDFRFYMYGKNSPNNYNKQLSDTQNSLKYKGVTRVPAF